MAITLLLAILPAISVMNAQMVNQNNNAISGYAGRYFLVGFMQNELVILPGGLRLSIHISTIRPTTVRIAGPITSASRFLQLNGDTVIVLTFPLPQVEMFDSETIQSKAIEIESDQPITVSGLSSQTLSTDGYSAIPVSKWGREYVIHSWPNDIYMHDTSDPISQIPRSSQFMVIASENNTVIEFTPRSRTMRQIQPGESTIITLNKGQCYLVKSDTLPSGQGDLSGTIIRADKPIGVFSGHIRTAIPLGLTEFDSKNHLIEMLHPTEQWGTSFITVPFTNDGMGDFFRIHGISPNTTVTIKGWNIDQTFTLGNEGDFRTLSFIRDPLHIVSDKPISIAQYMTSSFSSNERLQNFDPCMMLVPSFEKSIKKANFHVIANPPEAPTQFSRHYISLVCSEDAVDHVMLDNRLIRNIVTNLPNQRVNGTQMFYATVPVMPGFHQLTTMEGSFIAGLYGTGSDDAYAYPLAFGMVQGIDSIAPIITIKDSCGNVQGIVEEVLKAEYSGLHDVYVLRDSTQNMNWSIAGMIDGDVTSTFSGSVIDPLKNASMVIEAMDNAGNTTRIRYSYSAPKIFIPDSLSFDKMIIGDTQCRRLTVKNTGKESILIKYANITGDSRIMGLNLSRLTNTMIQADDSVLIDICFRANQGTDTAFAVIQVLLDCGIMKNIHVSAIMENPAIRVIGHDFGTVSVGNTKEGFIYIINAGGTDFTATSLSNDVSSNVFTYDTTGIFPLLIKPRDTVGIKCRFSPVQNIAYSQTFSIINDRSLSNQADVKGNGALPLIQGLLIDWKERRLGAQYDTIASITNSGNDTAFIRIDDMFPLDSIFRLSFVNAKQDMIIKPNETISLFASFLPKDTILYSHAGKLYFTNGFISDSTSYTFIGKGVIPDIEQKDIYVGRIREFTTKDTSGLLFTALGSASLTIQEFKIISGDISSFLVDTIGIINTAFAPGYAHVLPIRFTPQRPGRHEIVVELKSDAALIGQSKITRSIIWGDADAIDTIDVRMNLQTIDTMYVCEERLITADFTNNGNVDVKVDSLLANVNNPMGGSLIRIISISDSIIQKNGGVISAILKLNAQSPGSDSITVIIHYADSMHLQQSIPITALTNHIMFEPGLQKTISYAPGEVIALTLSGNFAFATKTDLGFEPVIEMQYSSQSIECRDDEAQFDMNTNRGSVRLPMQIISDLGTTMMNAQTQTSIQANGTWTTSLTFNTFLTDNPDSIRIIIKNRASDCIIGDTIIIPLELSEFCGKQFRVVTSDLKGSGLLGIYPHPIPETGYIAMLSKEESWYSYDLQNLFGQSVQQKDGQINAGLNNVPMDVSNLPGGSYVLIFRTLNHQWTQQIIISR